MAGVSPIGGRPRLERRPSGNSGEAAGGPRHPRSVAPPESRPKDSAPPGAARRLLSRLLGHRRRIALVTVLGAGAAAASAVSVGSVIPVLHVLLARDGDALASLSALGGVGAAAARVLAPLGAMDRSGALVAVVVVLVVAAMVGAAFAFAHDVAASILSQRVQTELAEDLYDRVTGHDERTLRRMGMGDLTARFTYDLDMAGKACDTFVSTLVVEPLTALFYFAIALSLSWQLTLLAAVLVPAMLLLARQLGARTRRSAEGFLEKRGELLSRVQETASALPIVQVYGQEGRERRRFRDVTERVRAWGRRLARLEAVNSPATEIAGVCALAPVLLVGGGMVIDGSLEPAAFLGVFVTLVSFYAPIRKSIGASNRLQGGIAGAGRIFAAMDLRPEVTERAGAAEFPPMREGLAWRGVTVTYADGRTALRDVTADVPARKTTALVGPSGSGKTTFLLMAARLVDPTGGSLALDGRDVRGATLASLRGRIAIVTQEPRLFGGTLAENIAYAKPDASEAEIAAAARAARVDEIVARFPRGLATPLDECGHGLSGGERQRIAIARAVLRDPEILLLDEPTSALDPENERLVRQSLAELSKGRTTLVVAHRAETVLAADHVIVLRGGSVEAAGPPGSVTASSPTFRELFGAGRAESGA
ncbi:MAG: Lipid A export ATP-binding/permease protein MsbA [Planctomycetes bacterium]|nr:Lipid A export ATP-binding/permease protein MsbA [Planctomycetota bacterium]